MDLKSLWDHARWADREVLRALGSDPARVPPVAVREMAHLTGTQEVWLARLEGRTPRMAVWPELELSEIGPLLEVVHAGLSGYISRLDESVLSRVVSYTNSAGLSFENPVGDILMHVCLHGQYHRGRINSYLRRAGLEPAPTDYIAFERGVPAATHPPKVDGR